MGKNNQNNSLKSFLENLPLQSENVGFDAAEMIFCAKCERKNPPNLATCIYCGEVFSQSHR